MARRPTPGVTSGPPAFPASSSPSAGPRPAPTVIRPAAKAVAGDDGNTSQSGGGGGPAVGVSGGVKLPDGPKRPAGSPAHQGTPHLAGPGHHKRH